MSDYDYLIMDVLASAPQDDPAPGEDEVLKSALLKQADEDRFGPSDPRTDDELWSDALRDENFRAHIRGEGR